MIRFRWHRGSLDESLKTTAEFRDKHALEEYIRDDMECWNVRNFKILYDYIGYDERCDWYTWYVCIKGRDFDKMCIGMAELERHQ